MANHYRDACHAKSASDLKQFQHDSTPVHRARETVKFLTRNLGMVLATHPISSVYRCGYLTHPICMSTIQSGLLWSKNTKLESRTLSNSGNVSS